MSDPGPLDGRRCLVTGCASGIGRRLAGDLARRGARVLATDLDAERLERCRAEDGWPEARVALRRLDVCDAAAWDAAVEWAVETWGGLDVAMNVAGYLRPARIHETTADDVHRHFDVNTKGVAFGTRAAARAMVEQGAGHVVNIASLASLAPVHGIGLYSASKYAVRALSLAAAEELRPHGVAVTVVCPDAVETPMLDLQADYEEAAITFTAPRFLTAEEVSRRIVDDVLRRRPLLVAMPRRRALLARLADLFPSAARLLTRVLEAKGRRRQERFRRSRCG